MTNVVSDLSDVFATPQHSGLLPWIPGIASNSEINMILVPAASQSFIITSNMSGAAQAESDIIQ